MFAPATSDLDVPPAVLLVDDAGLVAVADDAAHELLGYARGSLPGVALAVLLPDGTAVVGRALRDGRWQRTVARRANRVPFSVDVAAATAPGGRVELRLCELRDTALLAEAGRLFGPMFDTSPVGMAIFDSEGRYVRVNDALCRFLRRPREVLLGLRDQALTHPDDRASDVAAAWRILEGELDTWQTEKRFLGPQGEHLWAIANLTFLRDDDRRPLCWVGVFQDITGRKALEEQLRRLADGDPLTGLHNVRVLHRELDSALVRARRHREAGALLLLDLDGFKEVNDRYGHQAGDELLCAIAAALRERVRASDVVARVGGDEFAVLLPRACRAQAAHLAGVLTDLVSQVAVRCAQGDVHPRVSVGVATFDGAPGQDLRSVLADADAAMYAVKREAVGTRP